MRVQALLVATLACLPGPALATHYAQWSFDFSFSDAACDLNGQCAPFFEQKHETLTMNVDADPPGATPGASTVSLASSGAFAYATYMTGSLSFLFQGYQSEALRATLAFSPVDYDGPALQTVSGGGVYSYDFPFSRYAITHNFTGSVSNFSLALYESPAESRSSISDQTTAFVFLSTVPELPTWASLVAGFGLVGGALRRTRAEQGLAAAR